MLRTVNDTGLHPFTSTTAGLCGLWFATLDLSAKLLLVLKPDTERLSLIEELFSTANA